MNSQKANASLKRPAILLIALVIACPVSFAETLGEKTVASKAFLIPEKTALALDSYCYTCHDADTQKGDIRLDNLGELDIPKRLDLLNKMQEQLYFQHMPPKAKKQPADDDRDAIIALLAKELGAHHASTLEDKRQKPELGNSVNHEKLFSGECRDLPGFTYDRRWLISEFIFNAKFQQMLEQKTTGGRGGKPTGVLAVTRFQG